MEHPVQLSYCSAPILPIQGFLPPPLDTDATAKNTTGSFEVKIAAGATKVLDNEAIQIVDKDNVLIQNISNPLYEDITLILHDLP